MCEFLDHLRIPVNETERRGRIAGKPQSELYPYYGANGQVGWIDGYLFDEPLILLAEDGGAFGSRTQTVGYGVQGRCWVNNHAHVLRPRRCIDYWYCLYALSIRPDLARLVAGSTRGKLTKESAASIPVRVPALAEQRRIAARLTEQLAVVERARKAAQLLLDAAQEAVGAHVRAVVGLGSSCPVVPLGDVIDETRNGLYKPHEYYGKGAPILRMFNIGPLDGTWDLKRVDRVEVTDSEFQTYRLEVGDILVNRVNGRQLVGKCAVADSRVAGSVFESMNLRLRLRRERARPEFVAMLLNSYLGRTHLARSLKQIIGMASISRSDLESMLLPLPALTVQDAIVAELADSTRAVSCVVGIVEAELAAIEALPAVLLREAFQ